MIGRGIFQNPYCFTDHTPTREELMELLKLHLDLYEEYTHGPAQSGDEKTHAYIPSYEPLKHFFKIYINSFPGASELRAKLMATHSVKAARDVISML